MELLIFGHAGLPVLVFPTSMGRFHEYEDRGMVGALAGQLENGHVQLFCVDSVDTESWYNKRIHPADRVRRHDEYERYVLDEVMPLLRSRNWSPRIIATGCSFGGYQCMDFGLRHPDLITDIVSMSGAFDIKRFVHGYYGPDVYFHNPPDFVPNLPDSWQLDRIRRNRIVLAAGDWDICLGDNIYFSGLLGAKGIPHDFDVWSGHWKHDWPLWQHMALKFL